MFYGVVTLGCDTVEYIVSLRWLNKYNFWPGPTGTTPDRQCVHFSRVHRARCDVFCHSGSSPAIPACRDSRDHCGIQIDTCAYCNSTACHRFSRRVDTDRHSTKERKDCLVSMDKFNEECSFRTLRLQACLPQSRISLHFVSHVKSFEQGISFSWCPQRHFFVVRTRHKLQAPRWQRCVQVCLPQDRSF